MAAENDLKSMLRKILFVTTRQSSFKWAVIQVLSFIRMLDERWNDDIAYAFSIHKIFLKLYGLWPLQTQTVFTKIRWSFYAIPQFMIFPFLMMDLAVYTDQNAGANIENILYFMSTLSGLVKCICIFFGQKKLNTNTNAAIADWLSVKNDEKSWKIMRKYARRTRILTFWLIYSVIICLCLYVLNVVVINVKIFFTDANLVDADINVTHWIFLIPSGSLGSSISGLQFLIIISVQIFQTVVLCCSQCILDSFFFNLVTHLAGQLEILKHKITVFANERDTKVNRTKFVDLINRHIELMEFHQNLEDVFHFLLLAQLVLITIMLALMGLRINFYVNESNQIEMTKSILVMNYLLMLSLVYTYSADSLQTQSEDVFYAFYTTSWFTFPLALMKDMHFAMMRSSIPFRLTGGKFFYVNRETIMYILKTAASYVSVLRVALND